MSLVESLLPLCVVQRGLELYPVWVAMQGLRMCSSDKCWETSSWIARRMLLSSNW